MQYTINDRIIIDYPADEAQWVVTDTATDQVAKTADARALPQIIFGFGGPDLRQGATGYTDSGDAQPDA